MKWPVHSLWFLAGAVLVACPGPVLAGMPMVRLTDAASTRLDAISFFLAVFLVSALIVKLLWNYLRRDLLFLPRLTYLRALVVTSLWGLLFVLVLTMISGARELMTPGAWEKQGLTYKLAAPPKELTPDAAEGQLERLRVRKLEQLRFALWDYALSHDMQFPPDRKASEVSAEAWQVPDSSGMRYVYVGGLKPGQGVTPLAYEPDLFGPERLVLLTNGAIRRMTHDGLLQAVPAKEKP